ncbi:conjugal transfer protein TraA, partial [Acetobacter sp. DmW_125130]
MAIYHLSVKSISRSAGRSVVAAAAYRAGQELTDERQGLTHDYTRKQGVEDAFIVAPDGADWAQDRNALWNAAEAAEKRKDAKTGREYELALPAELDADARKELARDFAAELVERYGVVADVAIHEPGRQGDNRNHHVHILTTTRTAGK